jgi:hypothetical protein
VPEWRELERPPYVTDVVRCSCCGVMVARRYWDAGDGLARPYCSPECTALEERVAALAERYEPPAFPSLTECPS